MADSFAEKEQAARNEEQFINTADLGHQKVAINRRLAFINLWAAVAAFSYGYGASIIASSLGQPNFYVYFSPLQTATNLTQIIGAIACLLNVGAIFGVTAASYIADRWGRKMAFLFCTFFYLFGTAISGGAVNYKMFIMSRFVLGIGGWGYVCCCIVYAQELAPATRRGQLGGAVGVALAVGYISASWVGVAFYFVTNVNNWRIPILLSLIGPLIVLAGWPFVPESPRWLCSQGREEEAFRILKSLHGNVLDPHDIVANEELYQIKEQYKLDSTLPSSWLSLFTTYRKRTAIGCLVVFFYGCTGIQFLANFGPIIYASIGFSPLDSLLLTGGSGLWTLLLNFVCAFMVDKAGRKPFIVGSIGGSGLVLIIFVILQALNPDGSNLAMSRATVATFFIYFIPYSFCEPTSYLYVGEIFGSHIRTKGTAITLIVGQLNSIWITMGQPTGAQKVGYKFYIIFVVLSIGGATVLHFIVPETRNVPLEEIAALFGEDSEVAVRAQDIVMDENTHEVKQAHRVA